MFSLTALTVLAALTSKAAADLYITSPVAGTVCTAGQNCQVSWNDNGQQPSLSQIGACTVGLYVGSQTQQILLQPLGDVDVSTQASAAFIPDASVGGPSDLYFIRFTSTVLSEGQYMYEGFSAKFTLNGMTGTFNATEQSLMTAPTAPGPSTPPATSVPASTTPAATSAGSPSGSGSSSALVTSTKAPSSSTPSAKPSAASSTTSGAFPVIGSSNTVIASVAAFAVSALFAAVAF